MTAAAAVASYRLSAGRGIGRLFPSGVRRGARAARR
jgi:hypothetical protein